MVAPVLLGILGAGLATQAAAHGWAIPKFKERQGQKAKSILDELPDDAGIDDKRRALMAGGLLDPDRFAEIGFDDAASSRDFFEALQLANTNNAAAMDRAILGEEGANNRTQITQAGADRRQENSQNFTAEQNELDRQADQDVITANQWREADDTFWATQNALESVVAPVNNNIAMRNRAIEIAQTLQDQGRIGGVLSPEERNALMFELSEIDDQLFFEYKNKVYGEAEPPPAVLEQLRQSYPTFTDQPRRRWNETLKQYTRRNDEDAGTVQGAIDKAQQTIDRINQRFPQSGGGWALENPDQYVVQPWQSGGGVSDDEVVRD